MMWIYTDFRRIGAEFCAIWKNASESLDKSAAVSYNLYYKKSISEGRAMKMAVTGNGMSMSSYHDANTAPCASSCASFCDALRLDSAVVLAGLLFLIVPVIAARIALAVLAAAFFLTGILKKG